ncbi:hypothetical protein KC19_3G150800 [Ceratodon purpureus]|uniref:Uncharacterized protein n=1 Tax=Ceratodon purpureus TaxID=3225 RepID=A0A8T0ILA5_CERPU|nr:hypothetical protein KC19_3G150800 [Ceratodon purpureus]
MTNTVPFSIIFVHLCLLRINYPCPNVVASFIGQENHFKNEWIPDRLSIRHQMIRS